MKIIHEALTDGRPREVVVCRHADTLPQAKTSTVRALAVTSMRRTSSAVEHWIPWVGDPTYSKSPEEFAALMRSEATKWGKLLGQGTIKLE